MKPSQRRERDLLEANVVKWALDDLGIPSIKLKPGAQTGWPDQLFFIPGGRPLMIEMKWPGYEVSVRQFYIHKMLKGLGYEVETCCTFEGAADAIRGALRRAKREDRS